MTERTTTNDWSIQKHGQDFSLLFTSKFGASDANNLWREKEKEEKKKRILKSTKSTNHCRQSNCTIRIDRIFFLSTKKKTRVDDEECEKGHLSLVPSRIFSRRLKLKFYGGYDRNHWRVNRVKLVLYDVTIATFYKASWGP